MDVKEIKEKRDQLTRDIYRLVTTFHVETDVYVDDLGYRLLDITAISETIKQYTVELNIEIKL